MPKRKEPKSIISVRIRRYQSDWADLWIDLKQGPARSCVAHGRMTVATAKIVADAIALGGVSVEWEDSPFDGEL